MSFEAKSDDGGRLVPQTQSKPAHLYIFPEPQVLASLYRSSIEGSGISRLPLADPFALCIGLGRCDDRAHVLHLARSPIPDPRRGWTVRRWLAAAPRCPTVLARRSPRVDAKPLFRRHISYSYIFMGVNRLCCSSIED